MLLKDQRTQIVEFGKKLVKSGLTTGTGGNLSCLDRDTNLVAISPSGIDYDDMLAGDVVVLDRNGGIVEGKLKPSSETVFHLGLYRKRSDISAVVHTHSPYATTMACLNMEIPAVHYLVGFAGTKVPEALAENVCAAIADFNAVLMANHGLVSVGGDLSGAFCVAEEIEFAARIFYQAKSIGDPVVLSDQEMKKVIEKFGNYGQKKNNRAQNQGGSQ